MAEARERRQETRRSLAKSYGLPVLSFTLNLAGARKRTRLADFAFAQGREEVLHLLGPPVKSLLCYRHTGSEAFFVYREDAEKIKRTCLDLEEGSPVGRLYDMDVMTSAGRILGREELFAGRKERTRTCLVCGEPVWLCSRMRRHGLKQIEEKTEALLRPLVADRIADFARQALMEEAMLTPKPGLVDRNNRGAHMDMDLPLMIRSARALYPTFRRAALLGLGLGTTSLREIGLEGEKQMTEATGGVNTHRGALYALGLFAWAWARRAATGKSLTEEIGQAAKEVRMERGRPLPSSHGQQIRAAYGVEGPEDEAFLGFPAARKVHAYLVKSGGDVKGALLIAMLATDDANLLYRGGKEGLTLARKEASKALLLEGEARDRALLRMDRLFIEKNLSPGGSADMLALGLAAYRLGIWLNPETAVR